MTIRTLTKFRNSDRTSDLNERLSTLINKGVFAGGQVTPVAGNLEVDIQPLGAIGADGMVTLLEATPERVSVTAGVTQYVIMHAEYVANNEPIVAFEVLTQSAFAALNAAERAARFVLAVLDLPTGASEADPSLIDVTASDRIDQQSRSFLRGSAPTVTSLPDYTDPPTGETTQNRVGDVFYVEDDRLFYAWQVNPSTSVVGWLQVISTAAEARLDEHKDNQDDGTLAPDFFEAQHVKVPFRESHDEGSASVKAMAAAGADFGAGNAVMDELYPIGLRQRIEFTSLGAVISLQLAGFYYIGTGVIGTAANFFKLATAETESPFIGTDGNKITILEVQDPTGTFQLTPGTPAFDADNIGFYENPKLILDFAATSDVSVSGSVSVLCGARNFTGQVTPFDTLERASFGLFDSSSIHYPGKTGSALFTDPDFDLASSDVQTTIDRLLDEVNKRVAKAGDTITVQGVSIATALAATGGNGTTAGTAGTGFHGTGGTNSGSGKGGVGVRGIGGDAEGTSGVGVLGEGGQPSDPAALPGVGVRGIGSPGEDDDGGSGVEGVGGNSDSALGGVGVTGTGGVGVNDASGGAGVAGTGAGAGVGVQGTGGSAGAIGVEGIGTAGAFSTGVGVKGTGANTDGSKAGDGAQGFGGDAGASGGFGGYGLYSEGGDASGGGTKGGDGLNATGGTGGALGGTGVDATGGTPNGVGLRGEGASGGTGAGVLGVGGSGGAGVQGDATGGNGRGGFFTGDGTGQGVYGVGGTGGGGGIGVEGLGKSANPGVQGIGGNSSDGSGVKGTGGATNGIGVEGIGVGTGSGVTGTSPAGYGVLAQGHASGGASGKAALRIAPQADDSTVALAGDVGVNTATGKLRVHDGTNWNRVVAQTAARIVDGTPLALQNIYNGFADSEYIIDGGDLVEGSVIRIRTRLELSLDADGGSVTVKLLHGGGAGATPGGVILASVVAPSHATEVTEILIDTQVTVRASDAFEASSVTAYKNLGGQLVTFDYQAGTLTTPASDQDLRFSAIFPDSTGPEPTIKVLQFNADIT